MTYLLDTHVWLWALIDPKRLSLKARRALSELRTSEAVGLAAISLKEAAWHLARRRIVPTGGDISWADWLVEAATAPHLRILPLTTDVAIESERFPDSFPSDPADRLIAATARVQDLVLVTADEALRAQASPRTLW